MKATRHILSALAVALGLLLQAQAGEPATPAPAAAAQAPKPAGGLDAILKAPRSQGDDFLPPDEA